MPLMPQKTPTKATVEKWNFSCLGFETDEKDFLTKVCCETCKKYYFSEECVERYTNAVRNMMDVFVEGTPVVKKNNFQTILWRVNQLIRIRLRDRKTMSWQGVHFLNIAI